MEISKSGRLVNIQSLEGSDITRLKEIPAGSYVSGTIKVNVCPVGIKSSDFIRVERDVDFVAFRLTCAEAFELSPIVGIDGAREGEGYALFFSGWGDCWLRRRV